MNHRKIGPSLSAHFSDYAEEEQIPVWVRVTHPLPETEQQLLAQYGITYNDKEGGVIAARLTEQQVGELSEYGDWLILINWGGHRGILMR